ncbi:MAG TPA: NAD(P)-binding protein, partial [Phycisphaerae bacterium]|nr:NAD(P)-binding protein [Phycisphaerae bacterium]
MIAIIGAGLAGMSTSLFLKREHTVFEKLSEPGGLVRTTMRDGFSFDQAGHWFHARLDWVKDLMARTLGKNWTWHRRDARIYSHGVFTHYPFQINLGGLPRDVIIECLMGLIEARYTHWKGPVKNFEDFILRGMGKGVARHFMFPYNTKLWCLKPREMTTEWMGRFVPEPQIEQALRSALDPEAAAVAGYNAGFHYPRKGGTGAISRAIASQIRAPRCNAEIVKVNIRKRRLTLADGTVVPYEGIVSSMPLHKLMTITEDAPANVRRATAALRWVAINVLHLGVTDYRSPTHWFYVPEKEHAFFRVGCYSNVCPNLAPPGCASLYVEYSFMKRVPSGHLALKGAYAIKRLKKMGAIGPKGKLLTEYNLPIEYGYVLYDHNRAKAVATIQK